MAKNKTDWGTIIAAGLALFLGYKWLSGQQTSGETIPAGGYGGGGGGAGRGITPVDGSVPVGSIPVDVGGTQVLLPSTTTPSDLAISGGRRTLFSGAGLENVTEQNLLAGAVRAVFVTPEVAQAAPIPASLHVTDIAAANASVIGKGVNALDAYGNPTNYDASGRPLANATPIIPVLPGFDQYGHAIPGVTAPKNNTGFAQGASGWPSGIPVLSKEQAAAAPKNAVYVRTDGGYSPELQDIMNSQN